MPNITMEHLLAHLDTVHPRFDDTPWDLDDALVECCSLIVDADHNWFLHERLDSMLMTCQRDLKGKEKESEIQNESVDRITGKSDETIDGKRRESVLEDVHKTFESENSANGQKRQRETDVEEGYESAQVEESRSLKRLKTFETDVQGVATNSAITRTSKLPPAGNHQATGLKEKLADIECTPSVSLEGRNYVQCATSTGGSQSHPIPPSSPTVPTCSRCPYNRNVILQFDPEAVESMVKNYQMSKSSVPNPVEI